MSDTDKKAMKRLERDTSKRWIAGLCAGVGKTYILGWLLTPTAEGSLAQQVKEGVKNL